MGNGCDGDVGSDDGICNAGLFRHNAHANGQACYSGGKWCNIPRSTRLLSDAKVIIA